MIKLKKKISKLNLLRFGLFFFAAFPLIPNKIKGLPVILLLIIALYLYIKTKNKIFNWRLFLINSTIFFTYVFSLLYTSNFNYAFKKLEIGLSLLIIPLIFALIWSYKEKIDFNELLKKIIIIFFNNVFLFSVIVLSYLIYKGKLSDLNDPNFFRHFTEYLPFIGQHSIYTSIFLGLGLLFSVKLLNSNIGLVKKTRITFQIIFIIILLISLASKGVLLATIVSISVYSFFIINKKSKRFLTLISIFVFLILSIKYSPSLSQRVGLFNASITLPSYEGELNSTQTRKAIYNCSMEVLKDNWFFGHGFGDVNDTLMGCYKKTSQYLVDGKFNTHNQYLSIVLSSGIIGLSFMLYFLYFNFKTFTINKNYFFLSILLFYSIILIVENILERQSGVILFSFLINIFSFMTYNKDLLGNESIKSTLS